MRHWGRRGALAWLLWPASLVFGLVAATRRLLYRLRLLKSAHPGIPVIVVGNITAGGSGKTPLVLHLAELLRRHGWKPGIVSRGYPVSPRTPVAATIAADPAQTGDEPVVLSRRSGCPVWVAADRVAACRALREAEPGCNVIISDDGLQHYALRRDLEICVVDDRSAGNGLLFPAGPLREPRSRLASVDAVVRHGGKGEGGYAMALKGDTLVNLANANDRRPAASFAGQKVHAVAGIGAPNRFFLQLGAMGLQVLPHAFPDHHAFTAADLQFGDGLPVVMTEKDAVKCKRFIQANYWVLPVTASLDPAFERWLLEKLGGPKAA